MRLKGLFQLPIGLLPYSGRCLSLSPLRVHELLANNRIILANFATKLVNF